MKGGSLRGGKKKGQVPERGIFETDLETLADTEKFCLNVVFTCSGEETQA